MRLEKDLPEATNIMHKINVCKEIRLALTRAGIATRPEKCL
jgi:hypothetical protein